RQRRAPDAPSSVSSDLQALLRGVADVLGCGAAVWTDDGDDGVVVRADTSDGITPPAVKRLPRGYEPVVLDIPDAENATDASRAADAGTEAEGSAARLHVIALPPPARGWLAVQASPACMLEGATAARLLAPLVGHQLQATLEVEHAARELAERYEEINLLYTISEILGRTVALEEAASTILAEIAETVGARRGAILVHDRVTDTLQSVATTAGVAPSLTPIAVDDQGSASAHV